MASFQDATFIDGVEIKSFRDIALLNPEDEDSPEHNLQRPLAEWNLDFAK